MASVMRAGEVTVALPPEAALELFTARGEARWVPGWAPRFVAPADGRPVVGGLWLTTDRDAAGREVEVVWRVERFDPRAGIAEYLRVVPGDRVALVRIACAPLPAGPAIHTRVAVSYQVTPLSPKGEAWLAEFDDAGFAAMMAEWQRLLDAHLAAR
jgi:hypothetical protein